MMRVLIVEDEGYKRQRIAEVLDGLPGVDIGNVDQEADCVSALRRLRDTWYDLLILDLAVPDRLDSDPNDLGGLWLLDEIEGRPEYHMPSRVVGVTAHQHLVGSAAESLANRMITLIHFDPTRDDWAMRLGENVKHINELMVQSMQRPRDFGAYVCVVCALERPELQAVLDLSWGWKEVSRGSDCTRYFEGSVQEDGESRRVVAACASRKGLPAASSLACKMIYTFRPEFLVMPGITAAIAGKAEFGDVLVGSPCWDWGSGKWVGKDDQSSLLPAPYQVGIDPDIEVEFRRLAEDKAQLAQIRDSWRGPMPANELAIRIGPVASGAAVVADAKFRDRVASQHRELLGIEMEAYAVLLAASEATAPRPKAFALKSVVDFADGEKDDRYHQFAAFTSARVMAAFVERCL